MLSATLDVNALISAVITVGGVPFRILELLSEGEFRHITSKHIILTSVLKLQAPRLAVKYHLTADDISAFEASLRSDSVTVLVPPDEARNVTGDPEDDAVLATCRLGSAEYLVTGDRGLLALQHYENTRIVTPRAFLDLL
ncbi:MAG: putative toxin-antitoxin system toxin component, PIN family [Dehalococcoidia bacterium]